MSAPEVKELAAKYNTVQEQFSLLGVEKSNVEDKNEKLMDEIKELKSALAAPPLGTVEIIDCVLVEHIRNGITVLEKTFGDYSDGRYVAVPATPILFARPIPAKGQQGWWN